MGWKVITLDADAFGTECERLEKLVRDSGFVPEAVLSIRTGGLYVGESMFVDVPHTSVKLQRPSTKSKGRRMRRFLHALPRPVLNRLRIAEAWWLGHRSARQTSATPLLPDMGNPRRVLVVDDAVDSGATLLAVTDAVRAALPDADIRTAVITQTTDNPLAVPDYTLYNDKTLIRFPWSMDA